MSPLPLDHIIPRRSLLEVCGLIDALEAMYRTVAGRPPGQWQPDDFLRLFAGLHQALLGEVERLEKTTAGDVQKALLRVGARARALDHGPGEKLANRLEDLFAAGLILRSAVESAPKQILLEALLCPPQPSPTLRGDDLPSPRPLQPTAEYCLAVPGKIRWIGEAEAKPRLRSLLKLVLNSQCRSVSFSDIRREACRRARSEKTILNTVSDLNAILIDLVFPWTLKPSRRERRVFAA